MTFQLLDSKQYSNFEKEVITQNNLLLALNKKDLPDTTITKINEQLVTLKELPKTKKSSFRNYIQKILRILEKDCKLVARNYYRQLWMVLGLSVFGVPLGTTFGLMNDNMALLGIGMPIGMAIGYAVGVGMDKNAEKKDLVIDFEFKY